MAERGQPFPPPDCGRRTKYGQTYFNTVLLFTTGDSSGTCPPSEEQVVWDSILVWKLHSQLTMSRRSTILIQFVRHIKIIKHHLKRGADRERLSFKRVWSTVINAVLCHHLYEQLISHSNTNGNPPLDEANCMTLKFSLSASTDLQQTYHYPLPIYKTSDDYQQQIR